MLISKSTVPFSKTISNIKELKDNLIINYIIR